MTSVLVVNHAHSEVCGIHDIGRRIHTCLSYSTELEVGYVDCDSPWTLVDVIDQFTPDVIIFNYRADLMPWVAESVHLLPQTTFAVLHQYEEATADARAAELLGRFDHVLVLDPQLHPADPRVHAVGRPIPETVDHSSFPQCHCPRMYSDEEHFEGCPVLSEIPQIGSFGFAFPHKGFQSVAAEINDQCDEAVFNLHMPEAYFNGAQGGPLYTEGILAAVAAEIEKPGIDVHYTNEHLAERELVARLSLNDVNCLFYVPGQPDAGLSSAIDYLIAARRPMLVSEATMFRHAGNRAIWPNTRLGDILDNYDHHQQEADVLYNSMAGQLVRDIEKIVGEL